MEMVVVVCLITLPCASSHVIRTVDPSGKPELREFLGTPGPRLPPIQVGALSGTVATLSWTAAVTFSRTRQTDLPWQLKNGVDLHPVVMTVSTVTLATPSGTMITPGWTVKPVSRAPRGGPPPG